ncbi:protein of unknown function [Pararobbsia alpina]|uniref:helix-turn-helix domain-containing protein n=1 Tax=Pararobbsia alpina TaxID=621374 RepID=UPI0039A5EF72
MTRKFSDLEAKMSPERLAATDALAKEIIAEMNLANMRQSRGLSQSDIADALDVHQPAIAKIEQRSDMHVSTLRNYIEAMGGKLLLYALLPDGITKITFDNLAAAGREKARVTNPKPAKQRTKTVTQSKRSPSTRSTSLCEVDRPSRAIAHPKAKE